MSMLSQISSDSFNDSNHIIVIRVVSGALNNIGGSDSIAPLTFITVDFFDFETCYSGVFGGCNPQYQLTAQFKVEMDGFFVDYLQKESAKVPFLLIIHA